MNEREYCVYMMSNKRFNVLYTGVTNNISRRIYEHKNKLTSGFTKKYNVNILVYYEIYEMIYDAIEREKEIKGWIREKKNKLIEEMNSLWKDLSDDLT